MSLSRDSSNPHSIQSRAQSRKSANSGLRGIRDATVCSGWRINPLREGTRIKRKKWRSEAKCRCRNWYSVQSICCRTSEKVARISNKRWKQSDRTRKIVHRSDGNWWSSSSVRWPIHLIGRFHLWSKILFLLIEKESSTHFEQKL